MRYMLMCKVAELPPPQGPFPVPNEHLEMNFYSRLGIFMSTWQFIEAGLSNIYFVASKAPDDMWEAVRAAFYRGGSFATRLEMTNELVSRSALTQEMKTEWAAIRAAFKSCSEKRNKVAHGIVYWAPYETDVGDREMFVGRNLDDPKHAGSTERFYFEDLERLSTEFDQAYARMNSFYMTLAGHANSQVTA